MADKSPLPPVPPGVVQGYSDGFEYVPAQDGHSDHVNAFPCHWYLENGPLPFLYQASMAKPRPLWFLNPISSVHKEWKPIRGKYYPHVGKFFIIEPVSEVVLMTMAEFYKITARAGTRTYAVRQAEARAGRAYNPHQVYILGLEYMSGGREVIASQFGGSDRLAPLVAPLQKQFEVGGLAKPPAGLVGWCENVSETAKFRERRTWGTVNAFINLSLDHWLLTVTEDRMIYRSRPVHTRPDFAVTGPVKGRAAHYPVVWDVALDDIRTIEVRKLSEFLGANHKRQGLLGVVEVPDERPTWERAYDYEGYNRFWKSLGYNIPRETWNVHQHLNWVYEYSDFNVLFAFLKDGSRKVIWHVEGKSDWLLKMQATIAGYLEKAKVARSSGDVDEQDRRNYL